MLRQGCRPDENYGMAGRRSRTTIYNSKHLKMTGQGQGQGQIIRKTCTIKETSTTAEEETARGENCGKTGNRIVGRWRKDARKMTGQNICMGDLVARSLCTIKE